MDSRCLGMLGFGQVWRGCPCSSGKRGGAGPCPAQNQPCLRDSSHLLGFPRTSSWAKVSRPYGTGVAVAQGWGAPHLAEMWVKESVKAKRRGNPRLKGETWGTRHLRTLIWPKFGRLAGPWLPGPGRGPAWRSRSGGRFLLARRRRRLSRLLRLLRWHGAGCAPSGLPWRPLPGLSPPAHSRRPPG
jgi:hypothetical protein